MPSPTDRLTALRQQRRDLAGQLDVVDRDLDELLVDMWQTRTLTVVEIAELLGLTRQEVHRRIKRARER